MKKIYYVLFAMFLFFGFTSSSYASTYKVKSFKFLNSSESTNYATIGLTNYQTLTGNLQLLVSDISQAKSYVNFYMATGNAMLKETFSSSDMFFNFQKIPDAQYMYGSYSLDVYVVQVTLLGSWSCSSQGTNCTYSGSFSMKNFYNYQTASRVFSVVTTDERLDPNASVSNNVTVDVNGIINEQNKTNNKLDEIKDQNTEAEKTRKSILQTIIDLPKTIINLLIDALKSLFLPRDGFFEDFINDFKDNFLGKLGFLAYPFELIADIFSRYMNVSTNPVIQIPDIHEPFTGGLLIESTSVNLKEIFEYGAIGTMYGIYRSVVSVIICVMFLNFSIQKYDEFVKNKGSGN